MTKVLSGTRTNWLIQSCVCFVRAIKLLTWFSKISLLYSGHFRCHIHVSVFFHQMTVR